MKGTMRYSRWDERISTKDSNDVLKELALVHASRINSSTEREYLTDCINRDRILDLCDYNPSYEELSVNDATNARQVCAFYSKRADLELGVSRREVAVRSFIAAEDLCREMNELLRLRASGEFFYLPGVEPKLFRAQQKIARFLGDVPSLSDLKIRFGPGATTQVKKPTASPSRKLGQTLACSKELYPHIDEVLRELPLWTDFQCKMQRGENLTIDLEIHPGRLGFVPKSWKTERSIVVEPMLNTCIQLGINDYLSARFRGFGLDLTDQSVNQRAALQGSLTGELATLDLQSASDTISLEAVYLLLPIDWAIFLSKFRTGTVDCEGVACEMEKFSSMGNGFTFPLESLIFYGLACACVRDGDECLVSVFGDDVVIPTYAYADLCELFHHVGFIVNTKKSFSTGCFRESCGVDYHRGIDIRPSYVKDSLALFDIFRLHNQYVRRHDAECAHLLLAHVPPSFRKWGPDGYGDGHLLGDNGLRPHGRADGWCGFTFESYTLKPKRDFSIRPGDRIYPFYATYASDGVSSEERNLRKYALAFEALPPSAHAYVNGLLGLSTPGSEGVNLIKIYTLSSFGP